MPTVRVLPRPLLVAALVVALLGVGGLVRGAIPQPVAAHVSASDEPIVVTGAYVRQPAADDEAAAYFTIYNTTGTSDVLQSVESGAGSSTTLHSGSMQPEPNGITIPSHGHVTLSVGTGHVMISGLYGTLAPGQSVNLDLIFQNAGSIVVTAPVIGIYAKAPS